MSDYNQAILFSEEDLELFSSASGDRNPLHLSQAYASRTPYGERVVFGALGAIASLSHWRPADGEFLKEISVDFLRPIFVGVSYQVKRVVKGREYAFSLLDGSLPVVSLTVRVSGESGGRRSRAQGPTFGVPVALRRSAASIEPGLTISGRYACDPGRLEEIIRRLKIESDAFLAAVLCWSSYVVGMELPGETALFRRLVLNLKKPPRGTPELDYKVSVLRKRENFGQVSCSLTLRSGGRLVATGSYEAMARPQIAVPAPVDFAGASEGLELKNRVALIIGGSRGLGASISLALRTQGASVVQFSRSNTDDLSEVGDAGDLPRLKDLRNRIVAKYGRLDLMICNACPPAPSLRLEPTALDRIQTYLGRATLLVSAPMCVFLDLLHLSGGRLVVISSSAVENVVRDWPHYVAAKAAVEAYAKVAVLQYPRIEVLVVRPQKLLTDMTNTPLGRSGANSPVQFAIGLANRLRQPVRPGFFDLYPSNQT